MTGGLVDPLACVLVEGRQVLVEVSWRGPAHADETADGHRCGEEAGSPDGRQRLRMTTWVAEG